MARSQPMTIYRIAEQLDGLPVTQYEQALRSDVVGDADLETRDYQDASFEARLFLQVPDPKQPSWVGFLESELGTLPAGESVSNRAVLVVKVPYYSKDRFFALTFGFGRHMLRHDAYDPDYGLRVALNIMYEGDDLTQPGDPARVRRVNANTVATNTIYTGRQSNRPTTFDEFGVDPFCDLLDSVTGLPADTSWGSRVTGGHALSVSCVTEFSQIGQLCRDILKYRNRSDYEARFKWIDAVRHETDPAVIARLEDATVTELATSSGGRIELAPPGLLDWEDIEHFTFSVDLAQEFTDLTMAAYVGLLSASGDLTGLTIAQLRQEHRVVATDTGRQPCW